MQKKIRVLYPECLEEFKCIGGKCIDTCCSGWGIYIDKNTFEKYKAVKEKDVQKFITENINIREKCKNEDVAYGEIKLDKEKKCPFLDADNYCMIQKKFGEDYLSKVCTTFPRIVNKVDDTYEISLNISCMEAAKTVLLNKNKMKFKSDEKDQVNYEPQRHMDTKDYTYEYSNERHVAHINSFSIEIIQDRNSDIYERLYRLGFSLEYISNKLCYDFKNIDNIIGRCRNEIIHIGKARDNMRCMIQISLFKNILHEIQEEDIGLSRRLKNIISECEEGFMFSDGRSLMEKSHIYMQSYSNVEEIIVKNYSHMFENYIVNHIFQSLFPFSKNDIMINDYIMLSFRFSFIIFLSVGRYLYNGTRLNEDDILEIMQSLSKETEHSDKFMDKVNNYLRNNDLFNMKFARTLL
ncbi:MAG: flagellin lysine-N-methylase [Clostridium sp.]|nr:flagellin lysine-N-methylase [Clostridium sp.]